MFGACPVVIPKLRSALLLLHLMFNWYLFVVDLYSEWNIYPSRVLLPQTRSLKAKRRNEDMRDILRASKTLTLSNFIQFDISYEWMARRLRNVVTWMPRNSKELNPQVVYICDAWDTMLFRHNIWPCMDLNYMELFWSHSIFCHAIFCS